MTDVTERQDPWSSPSKSHTKQHDSQARDRPKVTVFHESEQGHLFLVTVSGKSGLTLITRSVQIIMQLFRYTEWGAHGR